MICFSFRELFALACGRAASCASRSSLTYAARLCELGLPNYLLLRRARFFLKVTSGVYAVRQGTSMGMQESDRVSASFEVLLERGVYRIPVPAGGTLGRNADSGRQSR